MTEKLEIVCKKCICRNIEECIHPKKREQIGKTGIYYGNLVYCPYFKEA